jgi:hypothetical protein
MTTDLREYHAKLRRRLEQANRPFGGSMAAEQATVLTKQQRRAPMGVNEARAMLERIGMCFDCGRRRATALVTTDSNPRALCRMCYQIHCI